MLSKQLLIYWLVLSILGKIWAFLPHGRSILSSFPRSTVAVSAYNSYGAGKSPMDAVQKINNQNLVEAQLRLQPPEKLMTLTLLGKMQLPTASNMDRNVTCLVLSTDTPVREREPTRCLIVPVSNANYVSLIEATQRNEILSKPVLLSLNMLLLNRDGALFDNLPWSRWTIDPDSCNRDAAGNPILEKYHMGKRDAYNRIMGKDWRSITKQLEKEEEQSLARRMLELEIKELEINLAGYDSELAVARNNFPEKVDELEDARANVLLELNIRRKDLEEIVNGKAASSWIHLSLTRFKSTESKIPPYRGATGYKALPDENDDTYTSPFALLKEIIEDQLNAQVIGTILENTSLLEGTTVMGGALILRRIPAQKSMNLMGEILSIQDEEQDFGNPGVKGGEVFLVECDSDEAIGMSIACGTQLQVESNIWERSTVMAQQSDYGRTRRLATWSTVDPELSILKEGQSSSQSATERIMPLKISRTSASLFDSLFDSSESSSKDLFPTDSPIRSLNQYDDLTNEDKARTLMSLSNFKGNLPRPRALRSMGYPNPLDELLLPLIDESVRRQYRIREAKDRGDSEGIQALETFKSKRQLALEKAQEAREVGSDDSAEFWEAEAAFYESLRADVTQDEGTYSRFLDRDDWYERQRQQQAKKLDQKKFGSLLDGVE